MEFPPNPLAMFLFSSLCLTNYYRYCWMRLNLSVSVCACVCVCTCTHTGMVYKYEMKMIELLLNLNACDREFDWIGWAARQWTYKIWWCVAFFPDAFSFQWVGFYVMLWLRFNAVHNSYNSKTAKKSESFLVHSNRQYIQTSLLLQWHNDIQKISS